MSTSCRRFTVVAVAGLVLSIALPGCREAREGEETVRITSLTVFPVTAVGEQHESFAEVLGLLLEENGFRKIDIAETPFRPEDDPDFDRIAAAFGSHIAGEPIETEFALYCEFQGTPKEGVRGIRGVVVDRTGKAVWKEVQTPADREFRSRKPDCPMDCCVFVSERLRPLLVMASPEELKTEGEMARLWARRSGIPGKDELDAMKLRQGKMKASGGEATVAVYPIRSGKEVDRAGAERLASLLNERKLCRATAADEPLRLEVESSSNEALMLWDMATAFQSDVRRKPPAADYVLYADYITRPGGEIWAVHFVVCSRDGDFVIADLQNNHHDDFNAIAPKSLEDCNRLTARRLAGYLK